MKPLAIDLFCGLGGWTEGLLAEGYRVVGFDIERHRYAMPESVPESDGSKGTKPVAKRGWTAGTAITLGMEGANSQPRTRWVEYPAQLVLQSVLTLHGKQFKDASLIVASPPCQEFSYMAMPWSKAKAKERDLLEGRDDPKRLTALFDACFRIQREACEAAGRHIPLVVENVRGAQKWVGRSRWNFGSFHLWGDVPALMPMTKKHIKVDGLRFDGSGKSFQTASVDSIKNSGGSWFAIGSRGQNQVGRNPVHEAVKNGKDWFGAGENCSLQRKASSGSTARKAASAAIAKIPFVLASYIARTYKPSAA